MKTEKTKFNLLLDIQAKKIKLSPCELAFMQLAKDEAGGAITPGTQILFDITEGMAVAGLSKKGLILPFDGEVEVTDLGAAWFVVNFTDAHRRRSAMSSPS